MRKLKYAVLDKLVALHRTEQHISRYELVFLICISQYQDNNGIVQGVYYRDVCKQMNISFQKFYDLKRSLEMKGVIRAVKYNYSDWNIEILGNSFNYPDSYKEGYINMSHNIFQNKDFLQLKAGEILLAMQFMKISHAGQGRYNIGTDKFYEKYTKLMGVTKRVVQNYMTSLRNFFSIGIKDKQFWITPLTKIYAKSTKRTDADVYNEYLGKVACRRNKMQTTPKLFNDTVALLKQYNETLKEDAAEVFFEAVKLSLEKANERVKDKSKWDRILQPKLVHKMLREQIAQVAH